jgi:DNA-binding transcriptional ArsR family regulator
VYPAFDLLASPTRLHILRHTWDRERAAGDIARSAPVTFGAVSQQLRRLREAGLLDERRDGRFRYYRANRAALGPLAPVLEALWRARLTTLKALAEAEERTRAKP